MTGEAEKEGCMKRAAEVFPPSDRVVASQQDKGDGRDTGVAESAERTRTGRGRDGAVPM